MNRKLIFSLGILLIGWGVLYSCEAETENQDMQTPEREVISTDRAPEAIGPYSQAIRKGNMLFLAGQVGIDPSTGELTGGSLEAQARQAMDNLSAVLEEAGFEMSDVVEVQVFLADMDDFGDFNKIYAEYFDADPPARAVVEASRIPLDAKVEIKMTAVK